MSKYRIQSNDSKDVHQIYGLNGAEPVLKNDEYQITKIDILENSMVIDNVDLKKLLNKHYSIVQYLPRDVFHKKYREKRTQGIVVSFIGEVAKPLPSFKDIEGNYCLLVIDNLSDPQNLGQIIRTSECAGIDGIIIPERNSVGITDAVLQVSQGAFCHIPIYLVTNLNQTLSQIKNEDFWTIAFENSIDAKPWNKIDYKGKIVLVVGSEGQGIKQLVLKTCDFQATIPMQGKTASLNVSAAVSAIVFERLRQTLS